VFSKILSFHSIILISGTFQISRFVRVSLRSLQILSPTNIYSHVAKYRKDKTRHHAEENEAWERGGFQRRHRANYEESEAIICARQSVLPVVCCGINATCIIIMHVLAPSTGETTYAFQAALLCCSAATQNRTKQQIGYITKTAKQPSWTQVRSQNANLPQGPSPRQKIFLEPQRTAAWMAQAGKWHKSVCLAWAPTDCRGMRGTRTWTRKACGHFSQSSRTGQTADRPVGWLLSWFSTGWPENWHNFCVPYNFVKYWPSFKHFFRCQNREKICNNNNITEDPPHLKCVAIRN